MSRETEGKRVSQMLFYGTLLLLGYLTYRIVQPFLGQIGWAIVLAICLEPIQARLRRRLGPTRAAIVGMVIVVLVVVLPITFAGSALVREGSGLVTNIQTGLRDEGGATAWLHGGWEWARSKAPFLPTESEAIDRVSASVGNVAAFVASHAGGLVKGAAGFLFDLAITLGLLFFLLRDASSYAAALKRVLPFGPEQNERLFTLTRDLVSASVSATLTIAAVQGLIAWAAFALLGIHGAVLWASLLAMLSLLPLVGGAIIWIPAAAWLMLSGSVVKGVILVVVGALILGSVDNVIRPLFISGSARLGTLVTIVSLMGGVSAFGFIGIVLGPLVAALVTALAETYLHPAPPSDTPTEKPPAAESPTPVDEDPPM